MSALEDIREGRAIDRCDHKNIGAFGDHIFDLSKLIGNVIVSELQIGFITKCFEGRDHALAIGDPTG